MQYTEHRIFLIRMSNKGLLDLADTADMSITKDHSHTGSNVLWAGREGELDQGPLSGSQGLTIIIAHGYQARIEYIKVHDPDGALQVQNVSRHLRSSLHNGDGITTDQ